MKKGTRESSVTALVRRASVASFVGGGSSFSAGPAATFQVDQKYTLGDVDNNGKIDSADALLVLQHAVDQITLTETQQLAANVVKDANIDSADALKILQYAVDLITSFD